MQRNRNNNNNSIDDGSECCSANLWYQLCYYLSPKFNRTMRSNLNIDRADVPQIVRKVLADASRLKRLEITKQIADLKALHGLEDPKYERALHQSKMHSVNLRYKDVKLENNWWDYRSEKAMAKNRYYSGFFAIIILVWTLIEFFSVSIDISIGYFDGLQASVTVVRNESFPIPLLILRLLMVCAYFGEWLIFRHYNRRSAIEFAKYLSFFNKRIKLSGKTNKQTNTSAKHNFWEHRVTFFFCVCMGVVCLGYRMW